MTKVLIVGGAGFCGANIAIDLKGRGYDVMCMDNLVRRGSELNVSRLKKNGVEFFHGDARNEEDFSPAETFKPQYVLDCSAQPTAIDGYKNPKFDITNNTYTVVNILEFCRKVDAGLIFWNSNKAYSGDTCNSFRRIEQETRYVLHEDLGFEEGFNELLNCNDGEHTIYGASKMAAEVLAKEYSHAFDIPMISNRLSCIYGPHQFGKVSQGWVTWFVIAKVLRLPLTFEGWGGKQVRDVLYISDLADLIDKQIKGIDNHRASVFNVGGGYKNTVSLLELSDKLDKMVLGNKLKGKVSINDSPRKGDQVIYISDISKVSREFNWYPQVSLDDGLAEVIAWAYDNILDIEGLL